MRYITLSFVHVAWWMIYNIMKSGIYNNLIWTNHNRLTRFLLAPHLKIYKTQTGPTTHFRSQYNLFACWQCLLINFPLSLPSLFSPLCIHSMNIYTYIHKCTLAKYKKNYNFFNIIELIVSSSGHKGLCYKFTPTQIIFYSTLRTKKPSTVHL